MFYKVAALALAGLLFGTLWADTTRAFQYDAAWKEVEKLRGQGLPQSMAEKVDAIYQNAVKDKQTDQQIKALIYQLIIMQDREEFSDQKAIDKVQEYLKAAPFPASGILHSMLGQLYWSYYQANRWRFDQRSETIEFKPDDIATWDLRTISKAVISEYQLSLQNPEGLKKHLKDSYQAILTYEEYHLSDQEKDIHTRGLRPTLYDFLAHRALDYYKNDESGLALPSEEFTLTDSKYFQPADSFTKLSISAADSLSLKYQALLLYQDLIRFHLSDRDPAALVDVDLDRLEFVYNNYSETEPEKLYESALRLEQSRYKEHPISTFATYKLALLINELGTQYNPAVSEDYRWYYKDALEICEQGLKAHPGSYGSIACQALKEQIQEPVLLLTAENINLPGQPIKVLLEAQNLAQAQVRIYRLPFPVQEEDYDYQFNNWRWDDKKQLEKILKQKPLWSKTFPLSDEGDYRLHSREVALDGRSFGHYLILASHDFTEPLAKQILGYCVFTGSELSYLKEADDPNILIVANRKSGIPVSGATVLIYSQEYSKAKSIYIFKQSYKGKTDVLGKVTLPANDNYWNLKLIIAKGTDTLYVSNYYSGYRYNNEKVRQQRCLLFTDRAIYRPGQTIYLKGVLYETDGEKYHQIQAAKSVQATFYDVNYQVISKQTLKTNEFGTFNTTFTAPKGVLTGSMHIDTDYGSVSFSVEEYKRPKFEVVIDQPKESYKLDQYVNVTGRAQSYAGFPIDNAEVTYRIVRQPKYPFWFWWWGSYPSTPAMEILHGTAVTDDKGEFKLTFLAQGDKSVPQFGNPYFTFTVTADVTDLNGETRSGSLSLPIGENELVLNPNITEQINRDEKKLVIPIVTTNLSGTSIPAHGTVKISRLQAPDHIQKKRLWEKPDRNDLSREEFLRLFPNDTYADEDDITKWKIAETVLESKFSTPETDSVLIDNLDKWDAGMYVLEAIASYNQKEVITKRYFTIYGTKSKSLPYPMADWFVPVKTYCEPGETASILIGSSYSSVQVYYILEKEHKQADKQTCFLNSEQKLISIPVTEQDRGGFYIHLAFIRDGRVYTHSQQITVPWTNKKIDFEYMTFRDKLLPGQQEEWRLKLKDYTGGKITAELLASMYDASLDAFLTNAWYASIYNQIGMSLGWRIDNFVFPVSLIRLTDPIALTSLPPRIYPDLNWFGYNLYGYGYYRSKGYGGGRMMALPAAAMKESADGIMSLNAGMEMEAETAQSAVGEGEEQAPEDLSDVQARSNFAETAFFYPELRTDENGEVSFVFTVPEALTRWKFRVLALTKDLKIGTTENTTITQKPLMVIPNAPRFFREGDRINFTAKVTSLDGTDQTGNCQLSLFDAVSMESVDRDFKLAKAQQPFAVRQGESTFLSWDLTIPAGISAVTCRVVARAGDFSDGEETTLPILTNRMLVTESLPLPVRGNTTRSFVFDKLKKSGGSTTIRNHKLTLEYTSNPAWYAVQALPYMMEYPHECNEQIFSRLYANSLASHIANANPRIQRVFEAWKNTPNSAALLSNLEKNQELKSVLLQETPWVLDAKNESQSKQRIGLLFDLSNMADQYNTAVTRLSKNQNPSGAWPWFPGMQDSWWVTQYIVEGFGHLDHLGVASVRSDSRVWNMIELAVEYLDRQILKDYNEIKKYGHLDDDHLGYLEMHYLYARSFFQDISMNDEVKVALDYFLGQADKYWLSKGLYGQGLIALGLHRYEKRVTPGKIVASLKEKALTSDEMGMWWKGNAAGWFWYEAPIETQSLLIEVFNDITRDTASIDEMRTWLLKSKQTTNWKTTKATAEACYALLLSGTEWLDTDLLAEITIAGKPLDPKTLDNTTVEAGTGYFKTSWSGGEITPQMAEVSVTNPNRVSSWGALYWQYFENLDKITPAETPLRLNKKLFIERLTDRGKVIEPISDKAQLNVGDKVIVRIELRSDRDMEYVHMKDMRAAGFEPINVLSRSKWQDGLYYYEATGDAATNFFIEYLRKGTYVFEYPLRVTNKGDFSNGITTIQCMYAPEFTSHSEGIRVSVN